MAIRGFTEKFFPAVAPKKIWVSNSFTALLIGYNCYNECATPLDFSKNILSCSANPSLIQNLIPLKLVFNWERHDSRMELDLMNKEDVPVIRTVNHDLFAYQHAFCIQGHCSTNTKHPWNLSASAFHKFFS